MDSKIIQFQITDMFWGRYQKLVRETVIPYQEQALKDMIPDAEKSHAIENFRLAAQVIATGKCDEEFYGMVFQDSDVAKWIEAAAYSLALAPDHELENRVDEIIALIGSAQHKDGYLNTYFTVKEPDKRWTNLQEAHELYCAGHMIEAAVAYYECTGKRELLDIMIRMADNIYEHFITQKAEGYPGHPEIELALMRLYRATSDKKYLELAKHFVDVRGVDSDYFCKEAEKRDWMVWSRAAGDKEYAQNHLPVREQKDAVGHAVRAVYLYTAMADLAAECGDDTLKQACRRLWDSITEKRMYVTGGIGSTNIGEAFTKDYNLPNDTAYAETCASIGLIFFARKLLELEVRGDYADVMERALYNCVLAGMQLDGRRFFYVNPLEVIPGISGEAVTHRHALPERPKWFGCACCPPNVARLIGSIGRYAWSENDDTVFSHLYIGGKIDVTNSKNAVISVATNYPYESTVAYRIEPARKGEAEFTLAVRIPAWSRNTMVIFNKSVIYHENKIQAFSREALDTEVLFRDGYLYITKKFTAEDRIQVNLDMEPKKLFAHSSVSADSERVALQCGPFVYCVEGEDNNGDVLGLRIKRDAEPVLRPYDRELLSGIAFMEIEGFRIESTEELYSMERPKETPVTIKAVPYYVWGNRGLNEMRVWLPEI